MSNNTTCYDQGGAVAADDIPCGLSSISTCCGKDWDCLSNGLCRGHGTTSYVQGSCTDPSFRNCLSICNQGQFDKGQFHTFTKVNRCEPNGNGWCCAGAAGQGLAGPDCCMTNFTPLAPYPFSTVDRPGQSWADTSSVLSTATLTSSPSSSSLTGAKAPTASQSSAIEPASSASPPPASQNHHSTTEIEIGVPLAVVIVLLASLAIFIFRKNRKQKRGLVRLQSERAGYPLPHKPEMDGQGVGLVGELHITHHELSQPDAPRHELW